ncbi:hypothetical protein [Streptomyces flavofungini]|uniref:hypothetical protein n=1 Tax=Streptomyces flavofungini TaxID=68200 RepID=UPI0025B07588|nr:hypothetical protein [Streptomyces flavofungini]WJV47322.1 hypothetical protein QUY26_18430 [Streptomyces flavofungini]
MASHDGTGDAGEAGQADEKGGTTYKVTVRNVTGHTTTGSRNTVVGSVNAPAEPAARVAEAQLEELRGEFARVREFIEGLDGAGEREKGAAVDRLEELEAAVTDDEPDVRTMGRVRAWFAEKLPAALGAVTALLLHPTAALLVQAAGEDVAAGFDGLIQSVGVSSPSEG